MVGDARDLDETIPTLQIVESMDTTTTYASQIDDQVEMVGSLRSTIGYAHESVADAHKSALFKSWERRTIERGKQAPAVLLGKISDLGFSWRDLSRMVGVSVPAVQKWRRSGGVSGANRLALAGIVALCEEIAERYHIEEVASWFEMPLTTGVPITPIDLYVGRGPVLVLEHASGHSDVEQILGSFEPEWRERYRSDFEVFRDVDGDMSIRPKGE